MCGIPEEIAAMINRFIDCKPGITDKCVYDPEWHDANRVIVDGHWVPSALLYLAVFIYERFQRSCLALKSALHHHLIDYIYNVISSGKYDWEFKNIVYMRRSIVGKERVCEEDNPEVVCVGTFAKDIARRFGVKLLDYIVKDFEPLQNIDNHSLLETLRTNFPGVFTRNELQLINRLQVLRLEEFPKELSIKLELVRDTPQGIP